MEALKSYPYFLELVEQALTSSDQTEIEEILEELGYATLGLNDDPYVHAAYAAIEIIENHQNKGK